MLRTSHRLRHDDGGWALVISLVLMTVMIAMGLGLTILLLGQGQVAAKQRQRETDFNMAEAALNAQIRVVGYNWPGRAANAAFPACTQASVPTPAASVSAPTCPVNTQLTNLIPSVDTRAGVTWRTEIRDNNTPTPSFYDDARTGLDAAGNPIGYDMAGGSGSQCAGGSGVCPDDRVWVRAEATVAGKTRVMVALLRLQFQQEDIIHAAVRTGRLEFSNPGNNKDFIDSGSSGAIQIRCDPVINDPNGACLGLQYPKGSIKTEADYQDALKSWIQPYRPYEKIDYTAAMSLETLDNLKDTAKKLGTYFTSCPSSLVGKVVYLDHVSGVCQIAGGGTMNSASAPGMVVVDGGALRVVGSGTYYGVLYYTERTAMMNGTLAQLTSGSTPAIDLSGTVAIKGGVILDGNTRLFVGDSNSGAAITFDGRGFDAVQSIATADVVQNTWREITK